MAVPFDPKTVVGRWQFELTDHVRQFHRQRLAQKLKPTGPVTLRLTGRDTLVMIDPERGELAYRRHSPAP